VLRLSGRTGTYVAVLDNAGEMITAVNDMALLEQLTPERIAACGRLVEAAELVIADCNVPEATLEAIAAMAAGKLLVEPVSVPKAAKLAGLQERHAVFLATPNLDQFRALGGSMGDVDSMRRTGRIRNIVIHQGAAGATVLGENGNRHVAAFPQLHVADVTGAGDAAVAGLAFGILRGYDLVRSALCGQAAASLKLSSLQSTAEGLSPEALLRLVDAHEA
jgi:pseudouridine kinase